MPVRILTWNAQGFHQQPDTNSEAFDQKLAFLKNALTKTNMPDLVALFEAGKSDNPNEKLIKELTKLDYKNLAFTSQDDGAKKRNTLGTMVFVKGNVSEDYQLYSQAWVVGDNERRAPMIIEHAKAKELFFFYHANASAHAEQVTRDALAYIAGVIDDRKVVFFGGDLNHVNPPPTINIKVHDAYHRLSSSSSSSSSSLPVKKYTNNTFYLKRPERQTHAKIAEFHAGEKQNPESGYFTDEVDTFDDNYRPDTYAVKLSCLDFAYVSDVTLWTAECDGGLLSYRIQGPPTTSTLKRYAEAFAKPGLQRQQAAASVQQSASISVQPPRPATRNHATVAASSAHVVVGLATVKRKVSGKPERWCYGMPMRSDHFPVLYEYSRPAAA